MSLEDENLVWIKVEPGSGELEGARAMYTDHETEKPDPLIGHLDEIKLAEVDWTIEDSKFDECVAGRGLYVDQIVKEEIVLGPEVIEQPKLALPYPEYSAVTSPIVPIWPKSYSEETSYKCHACRKIFHLEESLNRHIFAVHAKHEVPKMKKMHICKFCCQIFLSKNDLTEHLMIHFRTSKSLKKNDFINKKHTKQNTRQDKIISVNTFTASNTYMRSPSYNITPPGSECTENKDCDPPNEPYTCHACYKSFVLEMCFNKHMLDNHAEPRFQKELTIVQALPESQGKPPYHCQKCCKTFDSVESLTRHRFAIHTKREPETHEIHQSSSTTVVTSGNNPMRPCYFCYQWFEDKDDLMKHMEFHIEFASEMND
ncbi:zinc finger protein 93-like isoform X2 [Cydia strobilella]|uniref:zinc finger protein 93-like isoform X2 n=1 Tax=Cydia strobilella TaxID=1100964 RepID=UPI0030057FD9